jgi:hypothetical protein
MKKIGQSVTLVLAAALILASCGESQTELVGETTAADTIPTETTPVKIDYYMNVPEGTDFGGKTFTILGYSFNNGAWNIYLDPAEENGDIVNDAAYRRNREVEELLNISVEELLIEGNAAHEELFKKSVLAGDNSYDLICYWSSGARASFITEGIVGDWNELENIDLSASWYNQSANDVYSIGGKQYFAVSDFTFPVHQHWRVLFNKQMMDDFKLEYPYQAVYDGKWTYDLLRTYIKDTYQDVNSDGKVGMEDRFGLAANFATLAAMPVNAGEMPIKVTKNGFELNLYSERIVDIVEEMVAFTKNPDCLIELVGGNNFMNVFNEGRAMFETYSSDPALLRDIEFDYGYLPYPKFDEMQKDYIVWSAGGMMAYPVNAPDRKFTGTVMEALSAGSAKHIKDAFIEKYIEGKVLRDDDSVKIYRMMRDLATYDFSYNIDPSGKLTNNGQYRLFNQQQRADLSSWWAANKDAIQTSYDNFFAQITG